MLLVFLENELKFRLFKYLKNEIKKFKKKIYCIVSNKNISETLTNAKISLSSPNVLFSALSLESIAFSGPVYD
jgi:hypothetical protein